MKVSVVGPVKRIGYRTNDKEFDNEATLTFTVGVPLGQNQYLVQGKCFQTKASLFPGANIAAADLANCLILKSEQLKNSWPKSFASSFVCNTSALLKPVAFHTNSRI